LRNVVAIREAREFQWVFDATKKASPDGVPWFKFYRTEWLVTCYYYLRPPGPFRCIQIRPDYLQLPIALAEGHPRDAVVLRVRAHRGPGTPGCCGPAPRARRSGTRASAAPSDLARCLQGWHPAVEIEPIEPLNLQADMPADDVSQYDRTLRHATLPTTPTVERMNRPHDHACRTANLDGLRRSLAR
jgi:hypothetical protein